NVTKISEQDEQELSQSYVASSENIRSASCVLSKQLQVNASKLACNLENREDSSRLESCDVEELKSDQYDEVIAKLDKNIIVEHFSLWNVTLFLSETNIPIEAPSQLSLSVALSVVGENPYENAFARP
ncbi:5430_t:CDS:2, partial [Rhizophagus irregularis]